MYIDQHTLEKLGTARLVARYAPDYEEYLSDVFGREWRLADPVEIKGTVRLLARFVPEKAASGEENGPVIQLFIEFNPAMGLYTVTGEFRRDGKLLYKSSPRMGFDDEMLGDPARIFDWLDQSVSMGESHDETPSLDGMVKALDGLKTPAGVVEATSQDEDGIMVVVLDPEGRRSHDDFVVSGTRFPVAGAGSMAGVAPKSTDDWLRDYADPVLAAVQKTLDGLYGSEAFTAEMDAGGFVVVATQIPALKQETKEPGSWFAAEMRRMAGVDGSVRGNDKRISVDEVKKIKPTKQGKRAQLAKELSKNPKVRDPQALAHWIGMQKGGRASGGKASGDNAKVSLKKKAVDAVASKAHQNWQQNFRRDNPSAKSRMKDDGAGGQVDILNTSYEDLPEKWKKENKLGAEAAVDAVEKFGADMEAAAEHVHVKWLERNGEWAPEAQKKPYADLSDEEKEKDRVFVRDARKALGVKSEGRFEPTARGHAANTGAFMNKDIANNLEVMRLRLEGMDMCENCGCELEEEEIIEGEDGEMLCEACADEMYESIQSIEECACQDEVTEADLSEKAMSKFKKLVGQLKKGGATSPEGLAAWIGAKKMGKGNVEKGRKMLQKMAVKARKSR
jgi:hypothetical protein